MTGVRRRRSHRFRTLKDEQNSREPFAPFRHWSAETIAGDCFPTLTLEQVYGALAYDLAHRADIDAYLERVEATQEEARTAHEDPTFARTMARARQQHRAQDEMNVRFQADADFTAHSHSPGVILVLEHVPASRITDDLHLIWRVTEAEDWHNRIRFLPL